MPTRRDPCYSSEPGFPDISQLGEAIANAIQASLRPPPKTPLEAVYNLKLPTFMGNEGHEGAERWLEHVEKTFRVMQSQSNLPAERWVETTTLFLSKEVASWWEQESRGWLPEEVADWKNFKDSFYKRFIPPAYLDQRKQEFVSLRQRKLSANEYYQIFTDLSRYDSDTAANPVEMLRRFKRGTKKKWRSMATIANCTTYQEFYEVLLRVEDSENLPSDSEEKEKYKNQRRNDKGKGQFSQGPKKAQSFKRSGMGSSSYSGGFSFSDQRRGGAIIDILESVVEVAVGVILVVRLGIWLSIVPKASRDLNSLSYHSQLRLNSFQDLVVSLRRVVVTLIIFKGIQFLILQDSISTLRTLISRIIMVNLQKVICLISRTTLVSSFQLVDRSGNQEDNHSR
ncbi:hypothetical protein ACFX2C_044090 [Malus domestica]